MSKNLVIVESPAKARTITRFLGKEFKVLASMGHVRDLPKSKIGVATDHDFEAEYLIPDDKKKVIKELKSALKGAEALWIATDEDREGEAIGWHLLSALNVNKKKIDVKRIVFHEITESAIKDSLKNPRNINPDVVDAQQARRILDRLVGYELSPLLWKKVKTGLSAGRVQSVAVRVIVEREREIKAFNPDEYWKIIGEFAKEDSRLRGNDSVVFEGELQKYKKKKLEVTSEKDARKVEKDLHGAKYFVEKVEQKQIKRNPAPPFITSTLQQEASRKLNFSVKKTMVVAQQLYEGIDTGGGETGLITYMRTDSMTLSELAIKAARKVIEKEYGENFVVEKVRRYKKAKGAQEAHEAIRPVDLNLHPDKAAKFLSKDQARLYDLIWKRTIACQMKEAVLNRVSVDIDARKHEKSLEYTFRATGQTILFPGFMEVYMEGRDSEERQAQFGEKFLPKLDENEELDCKKIESTQHFTKPPPRYTEASLVKKLEEEGIGRPSTYAPVISTIQHRGYVRKEGRQLVPEDVAGIVIDLLINHFPDVVDLHFTAEMERGLDHIADGEKKRVEFLKGFYKPFHALVEKKNEEIKREDVLKDHVLGNDSKSGLKVIVRFGRFGPYVQLGHIEDMEGEDEKEQKKNLKTASLPKGMSLEDCTLEQALYLLSFPHKLGEYDGEDVLLTTGPYGPYLKWGKKNVSVPDAMDLFALQFEDAKMILIEFKTKDKQAKDTERNLGKDGDGEAEIFVKVGRYGPYVTDGKTNASLPKSLDPKKVTLKEAQEVLEKKRNKKK